MKEIRIYHRKELVEHLKLLINNIPAVNSEKMKHNVPYTKDNVGHYLRGYRLIYGIYECF